ncbi:MAG: hypothetical protein V7749_00805 [Cocleimonas sp.]
MNKLTMFLLSCSCFFSFSVYADACAEVVEGYIVNLEKGLAMSQISFMEKGIIKNQIDYINRVRMESTDCDVTEYFPDIKYSKDILKDAIRAKDDTETGSSRYK